MADVLGSAAAVIGLVSSSIGIINFGLSQVPSGDPKSMITHNRPSTLVALYCTFRLSEYMLTPISL